VQLLLPLLRDVAPGQWVIDSRPFSQKLQCRRGTLGHTSCDISNLETSWINSPVTQRYSQNGTDLKLPVRINGMSVVFERLSCRIRCEEGKSWVCSIFLAFIRHTKCIKDQQIHFSFSYVFLLYYGQYVHECPKYVGDTALLKVTNECKIKVNFLVFNSFYARKLFLKLNSQLKCGL